MTEIRNLPLLDPVDTAYFTAVQNAAGATAKLPLSAIGGGGGGGIPSIVVGTFDPQTVVPNTSVRYFVTDVNGITELLLPAAPTDYQEVIVVKNRGSGEVRLLANGNGIHTAAAAGGGYSASYAFAFAAAKGTFGLVWVPNFDGESRWQFIYDLLEVEGVFG